METIDKKTVAEIVSENIKTADIFKKNGIDFCCGGNVNVKQVCKKKGVDFDALLEELIRVNDIVLPAQDFNNWELDFLCDYITNTHHKYVKEASILLIQYADRVADVHGHHYSEVIEINKLAHLIVNELKSHMQKEETILFPFIKKMVSAKKNGVALEKPAFGTISNPINMMEKEHSDVGGSLKAIAMYSNDFTPPAEACNTFKALYSKLEEFQNDLFQHIHLENNILFPKAMVLENELLG